MAVNTITSSTIGEKALITLKQVAEILGLKYHYARKLMLNEKSIGFVNYGVKKLCVKEEIIKYKEAHYIKPEVQ